MKTVLKMIGAESTALVERQVKNGFKLVAAFKALGYGK